MPAPKGNQNALGNRGGGRETSYKKEYAGLAYRLCLLGATDAELADALGCCETTINAWKHKHVEFSEALEKGKAIADAKVAEKLYGRATGYSHPEEKVFCVGGEIIRVETIKHYPPDPTSMIFWLKNRQSGKWSDRRELTGAGGTPLNPADMSKEEIARRAVFLMAKAAVED